MGNQFASHRIDVLTPELNRNHQYIYPPLEGGNFFSTHYHLGSRKFETADPEQFLFGDLHDINYLTSAPTAFPYKQPPKKKPVDCLYSLLNLHKETVKLVRSGDQYTIEFVFDSNVSCQIYIFYWLLDISLMESLKHGTTPSAVTRVSQCYQYDKGLEQCFKQSSVTLSPSNWNEDKLNYNPDDGQTSFPVAILLETQPSEPDYQSLLTMCKLEKSINGDVFNIKVLRQKMLIDNMEYLIHETFGLENKAIPKESDDDNVSQSSGSSDNEDDLGAECVICFTDTRDTILLPCKHLCICASCAADLRYQASNCPICRSPFQALLQIQALQSLNPDEQPDDDEITDNPELYSVPGYKTMTLIQALNGYPKIKVTKACSTTDIPMSTGDEEEGEEEHDLTTNETVIPIEPSLEENVTNHTQKDQTHINGSVVGDVVTITASIESGVADQSADDITKSSSATNSVSSWPSSASVNSFNSRDVLLNNKTDK